MHKRFGFTTIELVVVMVAIGLLLAVGVVSLRSAQISARDKEREADVKTFANYLESIYTQSIVSGSVTKPAGAYPALPGASGQGVGNADFQAMLANLDKKSLDYPGGGGLTFPAQNYASTNSPCVTNQSCYSQTAPTAAALTKSRFMYIPRTSNFVCSTTTVDGSGQVGECRSFIIYYVLEGSPTTIRTIESKYK